MKYLANHKLRITQAPGVKPSSFVVPKGAIFELDGDEPINVTQLLSIKAITAIPEAESEEDNGEDNG